MNTDPKHWLSNRGTKTGTWSVDSLSSKSSMWCRSICSRKHPAFQIIQYLHFFYFSGSFLPFWIQIRIRIQPTKINVDPRWSGSEHLVWTVLYSYQIDIKSGTWSVDSLLSKSSNVSRVYLFQSRVSTSSGTLNTSLATATILPAHTKHKLFKGTVSRAGLGFWWHKWIYLGQNKRRAWFFFYFLMSLRIFRACILPAMIF